jgi:hypothetical protein
MDGRLTPMYADCSGSPRFSKGRDKSQTQLKVLIYETMFIYKARGAEISIAGACFL